MSGVVVRNEYILSLGSEESTNNFAWDIFFSLLLSMSPNPVLLLEPGLSFSFSMNLLMNISASADSSSP